jgi:hypothetical protein
MQSFVIGKSNYLNLRTHLIEALILASEFLETATATLYKPHELQTKDWKI